jgi:exodeoxyribonuclease-5
MVTVEMHAAPFKGEKVPYYEKKDAQEFDFGYAITVHKSQGSQWESVLVVDESFCFGENRFKWLYTGITRAASKVAVLKTAKPEWR